MTKVIITKIILVAYPFLLPVEPAEFAPHEVEQCEATADWYNEVIWLHSQYNTDYALKGGRFECIRLYEGVEE